MSQDLQRTIVRTTTLEERLSQVADNLNPMKPEFKAMQVQMGLYKAKMDEIENRSRRNNVRVVGFPERCEGSHPAEFLEKWLKGTFGIKIFSHLFAIERAHRVPSRAPPSGGYPRPIIIKMLNYKDKVTLMQKARELGDIFIMELESHCTLIILQTYRSAGQNSWTLNAANGTIKTHTHYCT